MPDDLWNPAAPDSREPGSRDRDVSPEGSTIEVVEATASRLVLFIPAGAKRGRELGCFGLIWTTMLTVITAAFANGVGQPGGPGATALLFLVPFWLAGLGMLYFALRMRHTRTLLLVDPSRAVLQQTFLGRTRTREAELTPGDGATLVESYRQNDVPVDAVCLKGTPASLRFGTPLEPREKAWLVDRINRFLGVSSSGESDFAGGAMPMTVAPTVCRSCGGELPDAGDDDARELSVACPFCGEVNSPLMTFLPTAPSDTRPATGPFPDDQITIAVQMSDELSFSMPVFENSALRRGAAGVFLIFSVVWNSIVAGFVWNIVAGGRFDIGSIFMLLFLAPFVAIGAATLWGTLFIVSGRLRVHLDRQRLRASWSVAGLGYSRSLPTDDITHVTVENSPMATKNDRGPSRSEPDTRMAIVWAGERWIPVTMLQGVNDCRHVAELVRRQLREMGFRVADQRMPVSTASPLNEDEDDVEEEEDGELN